MNSNIELKPESKKPDLHLKWLYEILIKPRSTFQAVNQEKKNAWLIPLAALSVLAILQAMVTAPIKRNMIQMGLTTPPNFQYYSPEQQTQFYNAQATQTSFLFLYVFPILFALLSIWLSWFLLSSILHLVLTLSGSHAPSLKSYYAVGWSMIPLGIRSLVQIIAMLATRSTINGAGLSGLFPADASGFTAYLAGFLGLIDVFFIWHAVVLIIGAHDFSGLSRKKVILATLGSIVIFMLIFAVPGFLKSILSNLSFGQYYFF
jgi:hypothetical protein